MELTITINSISSKNHNDEECETHSKSNNIKIMINDEVDEPYRRTF